MAQNYSYWEDVLYGVTYDLIVVGGGLTGQSAAYFYKKEHPDAEVLIVDRGFFPIGASTRNAGFACIGTIGEHLSDLKIDNESQLKERIKNRYQGLLLLRETLGDESINYEHCGGWEISVSEESRIRVPFFNAWMEEIIGEKEVYRVCEYQGYTSIFNRIEGMLHPGRMIQKLYKMNRDLGIEFRWNTPVHDVMLDQNEVKISDDLSLKTKNIVLATNAFTNKILPDIKINPGRGYVFLTKPLQAMNWKGTFHFNNGYVYFRNIGEDRILLGGGRNADPIKEETHDFGINDEVKNYLIDFAINTMKLPEDFEIEQEWSGIMGFTESKSPILKKLSSSIVLIAGLSGMGVALGMQMGKKAASQL